MQTSINEKHKIRKEKKEQRKQFCFDNESEALSLKSRLLAIKIVFAFRNRMFLIKLGLNHLSFRGISLKNIRCDKVRFVIHANMMFFHFEMTRSLKGF